MIHQDLPSGTVPDVTTLAERLGYAADTRLVIINSDDLGLCHAANTGIYESLRQGLATSATLMVPCPWAREAASDYRGGTSASTSPSTPNTRSTAGGRSPTLRRFSTATEDSRVR